MNTLIEQASSFPLIVFTLLLGLLALYWLLVMLRLTPTELFEHDSLKQDHLASTMVGLGFAGVPVSMALSVLTIFAGLITLAIEWLVLSRLSLGFFRVPAGFAVLWAAFALASPLASALCRRLHAWLHRHPTLSRRCLLGETVRVVDVTGDGDATAVLEDDEDRQVVLQGKAGNQPARGERRVLVKYLGNADAYRSVLEQDYLDARTRLVKLRLAGREGRPDSEPPGRNGSSTSA
ncbi:hypothetical protein OM427_06545 [Halomonas sp. 18H]|uniref:hypothetical protein n=1 Tax=Halomonas almeriensis TaxID=308163 RepID=UPI00222E59A6|nr:MULTISPECIES: hypothetical protein [Halomonas]MCW4149190.1 hypothetical protein [Halomonas sp. 18H]MDN3552260.1 hypothetical protein [Halomonas almeriensis]